MIEISHLSKTFGDLEVLSDISLNIEKGDIYGIIGQSGAGKSTLLRCLNGLETFDAGEVTVDGQPIRGLGRKEMREIQKDMGIIFQNFNLLSRLDVYDNVALPLTFWGKKPSDPDNDARIRELIKLVGLEDKIHQRPAALSGGQKQRVAIARALVLNPNILLCDEATSALDPKITQDILKLLKQINEELGLTIVVVTHQMEVIKGICNRVAFLKNGHIVAEGKPEDLFISSNKDIRDFTGETTEFLPSEGTNIKLLFGDDSAGDPVITGMARELNFDFSIASGKLEKFRDRIMGSLIINIDDAHKDEALRYLKDHHVEWEVIEND